MKESTVDDLYEALDGLVSAIYQNSPCAETHSEARAIATELIRDLSGWVGLVTFGQRSSPRKPGNASEP